MNYCGSCGVPIPDGQSICSMCYGDPYYGHDGYYLNELEQEEANRHSFDEEAFEDYLETEMLIEQMQEYDV